MGPVSRTPERVSNRRPQTGALDRRWSGWWVVQSNEAAGNIDLVHRVCETARWWIPSFFSGRRTNAHCWRELGRQGRMCRSLRGHIG